MIRDQSEITGSQDFRRNSIIQSQIAVKIGLLY